MKLLINFISKLGVDSVARLIGFITLPVITRALGPDGYGLFTYLFVITSYFGFFIDFGYLNYGTNKLCEKIDSSIVISRIISLQLLTALFSYIILIISAYFIFDFDKYFLLLLFSITYIGQIISIKYYYLAKNKLYYNSLSELAGQLVYAILIFLLFTKYPGILVLIILSVIQITITALFLFLPFIRNHKIDINLSISINLKTLKEAYKLGLATKAEGLTSSFIILSIGILLSEQAVGFYNASYKIYLILLTIVQGVSFTLMPMLLSNAKSQNRNNVRRISFIFYIYVLAGVLLFVVTFFFANSIITIMFGDKFLDSVIVLKTFSITILIWPALMFMGLIMLAYNRYNYILFTCIFSTIFSVTFSLLLINVFGMTGAGFVLPCVGIMTIIISIYFLSKIAGSENFQLKDIFSFHNAINELKFILSKKEFKKIS